MYIPNKMKVLIVMIIGKENYLIEHDLKYGIMTDCTVAMMLCIDDICTLLHVFNCFD